jgi:hypothetical protein
VCGSRVSFRVTLNFKSYVYGSEYKLFNSFTTKLCRHFRNKDNITNVELFIHRNGLNEVTLSWHYEIRVLEGA